MWCECGRGWWLARPKGRGARLAAAACGGSLHHTGAAWLPGACLLSMHAPPVRSGGGCAAWQRLRAGEAGPGGPRGGAGPGAPLSVAAEAPTCGFCGGRRASVATAGGRRAAAAAAGGGRRRPGTGPPVLAGASRGCVKGEGGEARGGGGRGDRGRRKSSGRRLVWATPSGGRGGLRGGGACGRGGWEVELTLVHALLFRRCIALFVGWQEGAWAVAVCGGEAGRGACTCMHVAEGPEGVGVELSASRCACDLQPATPSVDTASTNGG